MSTPSATRPNGTLFIVATPIGNIRDITDRAKSVLEEVTCIACEDTRRAAKLLRFLSIDVDSQRLCSFNMLNERDVAPKIIEMLRDGEDIALISDAGTPIVSDPGLPLLRVAYENDVNVVPVPGASALTACLSACPIPLNEFRFIGFLERKPQTRRAQLHAIQREAVPVVCFESPNRVIDTLRQATDVGLDERHVFIAREITKLHEEKIFDTVANACRVFEERERVQGEFVIVFDSAPQDLSSYDVSALAELFATEEIAPSVAARLIANIAGVTRREAYNALVATGDETD